MAHSTKFRYAFDINGKYQGLVRSTNLGLFPELSTPIAPHWVDGYLPHYNVNRKKWENIPREKIPLHTVESAAYAKVYDLISGFEKQFGSIHDEIINY